jgi:hypothetical protein
VDCIVADLPSKQSDGQAVIDGAVYLFIYVYVYFLGGGWPSCRLLGVEDGRPLVIRNLPSVWSVSIGNA